MGYRSGNLRDIHRDKGLARHLARLVRIHSAVDGFLTSFKEALLNILFRFLVHHIAVATSVPRYLFRSMKIYPEELCMPGSWSTRTKSLISALQSLSQNHESPSQLS